MKSKVAMIDTDKSEQNTKFNDICTKMYKNIIETIEVTDKEGQEVNAYEFLSNIIPRLVAHVTLVCSNEIRQDSLDILKMINIVTEQIIQGHYDQMENKKGK